MKILYRLFIAGVFYFGSIFFFTINMEENTFSWVKDLIDMSEASLPVISFRIDDNEINRVHGYCSATEEMLIRESMLPVTSEQSFTVIINEGSYNIKKINYEILDADTGQTEEEGTVIAFDKENGNKTAKINIKNPLAENKEYILKITLISNESKRIYYYSRLLYINNAYLTEKMQFVEELQNNLFTKNTDSNFKKYLEYKKGVDTSSFARVDIYSGEDMVSFGRLDPSMIYKELPMITEFGKDTASVVMTYYISVNTENGKEYYCVKDYFRFGYTSVRVYLYNFEREMESIFIPENMSLTESEFKLGITDNYDIDFFTNSSDNIMAFVRERELWSYDASAGIVTKVFSFKQENTDYIRDVYDQHDIKIMNMDEAGNIHFMVYGYMNRGEYEGRVGIVIYRYDKLLGFIEEIAYIPMNTTYQILKEEIGDVSFFNQYNTAYFMVNDTIYSYNFVSKTLIVHAEDVNEESILYSKKGMYAVWQNSNEKAQSITILMLDTGTKTTVYAGNDEYIKLLTTADDNIIYGFIKKADVSVTNIGTNIYPMYKICISSKEAEVLREYEKEGYYIISAEAANNKITLHRVEKSIDAYSGYVESKTDHMLNSGEVKEGAYSVTTRITDKMLKEYYIAVPSKYAATERPVVQTVKNSVIMEDTTVRLTKQPEQKKDYYAYSFGGLIFSSDIAGEAVLAADEAVGTVMDSSGRIIWQRGAKGSKQDITSITPVYVSDNMDSIQAVLKMLFQYKGMDVDTSGLSRKDNNVMEWIEQYLKLKPLNLTGAGLNEILYMVYKNKPVIGMQNNDNAVLIIGYDSYSVTIIDPSKRRTEKLSLSEAEEMFQRAGNVFVSYMD